MNVAARRVRVCVRRLSCLCWAFGLITLFNAQLRADSEWRTVECVPADLQPETLFQVHRTIDEFEVPELNWHAIDSDQSAQATLHRDLSNPYEGQGALRVEYRFVGRPELEYLQLQSTQAVTFDEPGLGLGFWLRHDGTPFTLRMRVVDTSGETHQLELQASTEAGWQFVVGRLDAESSAWGGDANGRKDYPCRLSGIVLDRPQRGFAGRGNLWIDNVVVVKPRNIEPVPVAVAARDARFGNLYAVGDSVALQVAGTADQLRWQVRDFFGQMLASGIGPARGTRVEWMLEQPGWFECRLELLSGERVVGTHVFSCAALPDGRETARSDFAGVCSHFGQNRYPLECMALMLRYGIDQYRDEIGWQSYERRKGQYVLPDYAAAFLHESARLQMRPLLIFDYGNPHYDNGNYPNSPEAVRGFTKYAVDLAGRTQGIVPMFEVWNEWIGGCGMMGKSGRHDAEAYGRLLKSTYTAVKSAFPDRTVVGIGGEYGEHCTENILTAVDVAGPQSMDAWSIHPYRYPRPPESSRLAEEVARISDQVQAAGVRSKAWVTEIGYPTHRTSRGCSPADQARYCVRSLILLQSTGMVEKVFWYDLKDDGTSRDYNEHNFGLIHHQQYNCAPKPGIVALSVLVRMVGNATFLDLKHEENWYAASYRRPDGRMVMVAWTSEGKATLPLATPPAAICDMMGASRSCTRELELSQSPIYAIGATDRP